jgi:hypothetical protein
VGRDTVQACNLRESVDISYERAVITSRARLHGLTPCCIRQKEAIDSSETSLSTIVRDPFQYGYRPSISPQTVPWTQCLLEGS